MKLVRFGDEYYAGELNPTDPPSTGGLTLAATSWEAGEVPKSNTACSGEAWLWL